MRCVIVEDDVDDKYITETFLREISYSQPVVFMPNGDRLFDSLLRNGNPSLILIGFSIGPEDGLSILKKLKANVEYRSIPVVILSGSVDAKQVKECYLQGASAFIQKPDSINETRTKISTFFKYWTEVAETL